MALRTFQNNPSIGGFGNESGGLLPQEGQAIRNNHSSITINSGENINKPKLVGTKTAVQPSSKPLNQSRYHSSAGSDAFAQILKELVDNAVDACSSSNDRYYRNDSENKGLQSNNEKKKRVKVSIEKVESDESSTDNGQSNSIDDDNTLLGGCDEILQVTVSDNGCGMEDIEKCVSAFSSSKGGTNVSTGEQISNNDLRSDQEKQNTTTTAGRYGIGLTLCLLHAQRLVPNSCTSIISSTSTQPKWKVAKFVVDADRDKVVCVEKKTLEKKRNINESGTIVRLCVPGGVEATRAWPRLAEYFNRFKLSIDLQCSLQVMAPSLSTRQLYIRPLSETKTMQHKDKLDGSDSEVMEENENSDHLSNNEDLDLDDAFENWINNQSEDNSVVSIEESARANEWKGSDDHADDGSWVDNLQDDSSQQHKSIKNSAAKSKHRLQIMNKSLSKAKNEKTFRRQQIQSAVSSYLHQLIPLENIASSVQKLRCDIKKSMKSDEFFPTLQVDMIVYEDDEESYCDLSEDETCHRDPQSAKIFLVRMVNHVPILDGAEASACGIVQGILRNHTVWNSFGLDVTSLSQTNSIHCRSKISVLTASEQAVSRLHIPTFSLRDSMNVAPYFLQNRPHDLFEDDESSCESFDDNEVGAVGKRKKKSQVMLLPAGLRIGKLLIVVHLVADPQELPLPTLSKGRLPMNEQAIDDALELGIIDCLQSLQKSKPSILLDATQLKKTERDIRFIPAVAGALSSLIHNCEDLEAKQEMLNLTKGWNCGSDNDVKFKLISPEENGQNSSGTDYDDHCFNMNPNNISQSESMSCSPIETNDNETEKSHEDEVSKNLEALITSKIFEVMSLTDERKREQNKQSKAEYCRRKKTPKCESSDDSSSTDDLEDFLSQGIDNKCHNKALSTSSADSNSDENSDNETYNAEGRLLNSEEDDFDDKDWL